MPFYLLKHLAFLLLFATGTASGQERVLADFPFWQANAGWWRSDNTYFDKDMNYNIRSYNSVIHIELDGRTFRETEYKTYAPSKLATARGAGKISDGEGIEAVTVTTGELVDDQGTVQITRMQPPLPGVSLTTIGILDNTTGARVTRDPESGMDAYRMLISLPTRDKRYIANYGLVSRTGELRGFSIFRGTRIAASEAAEWREKYRSLNNVAAVITAGEDGKPVVQRLAADRR